jgi:hypothetical protein
MKDTGKCRNAAADLDYSGRSRQRFQPLELWITVDRNSLCMDIETRGSILTSDRSIIPAYTVAMLI